MSARHIDPELRVRAAARTEGRCAYCGNEIQSAAGAIDFFRPIERGGTADDDNALYCCHPCSRYKGHYWHETDPPHVRLLHPFKDALDEHLSETEVGVVVPRSAEGRFYIERLHLNRAPLVERRRALKLLMRARHLDEELRLRIEALGHNQAGG